MMKVLKYTLFYLAHLVVLAVVGLGIMWIVSPYKVKRWLGIASSYPEVFVDRLKGRPYTNVGYDGIDVSKHNGVIKWGEIAKNKRIKFVYIRATHGTGYTDRHYHRNVRLARKYGLKVGSYHLMSAGSSATAQFQDFQKMVKKSEQDLIPMLDVEQKGIHGGWKGRQLQDSVQVFVDLVKKHYGKYPIIYSNENFYNNDMGAKFNRYYLFIANYNSVQPFVNGGGKCNIWQYSETGHLHGIGERVDLSRFMNGTTINDLML